MNLNDNELDLNVINRIVFSDEATFPIFGHVYRHNSRIRGSENHNAACSVVFRLSS